MRFATLQTAAGFHVCLRDKDDYVDLYATDPNLPISMRALLGSGPEIVPHLQAAIRDPDAMRIPVSQAVFGPVVPDSRKIIGVGLNYRDHAIEGGKPIPDEPVIFAKYPNVLIGHKEPIRLPAVSQGVDYEAELVVVIGKMGRNIAEEQSMQFVAGYTCGNDVSARDWQYRGDQRQWTIGKTFDTFGPVGPEIVTANELADPHQLRVQMRLNGKIMQDSNTKEFIFGIPKLIAYLSQVMTLEPGDLVFTGTPPGVGSARRPPVWLRAGDLCEVEIEGIGVLRNHVVAD